MRLFDYCNVRLKDALKLHMSNFNEAIFKSLSPQFSIINNKKHDSVDLYYASVLISTIEIENSISKEYFVYYYLDDNNVCELPLEKNIYDLLIKNLHILRSSISTVELPCV